MLLIYAPTNQEFKIVKILADEKLKKHLEDLGILPNGTISLLSVNGGNAICLVKNVRLALDKITASKILVA
ncbi:MAG: ferrous iron transport protein A [Bacilli bacterium]|nr:ferrous iron transport protein A [Bacilli bacterium]